MAENYCKIKCYCLDDSQAYFNRRAYEFTKEGREYYFFDEYDEDGEIIRLAKNVMLDELALLVESLRKTPHPNKPNFPNIMMIDWVKITLCVDDDEKEIDLDAITESIEEILEHPEIPFFDDEEKAEEGDEERGHLPAEEEFA